MATRKPQQLTSWSISRYRDFDKCPLFCKLKHLDKLAEPGNDAMARGTAIHLLAEDYVKGNTPRLPKELKLFKEEFAHLKKIKASAEEQWTFDKQWNPCEWNDWNRAWLRVKIDVNYIFDGVKLKVIDHKTGSMRPQKTAEYQEQLELTAAAAFQRMPEIEVVEAELWYLDHGIIYPEVPEPYERKRDAKKIIKVWEKNAARMLNTTVFKAKPGRACEWCFYRKSNNGPCVHG